MWVEGAAEVWALASCKELTTMWVVTGYGEYIIYNNQEEAIEFSNELSYAVTERHVKYNISEAEELTPTLYAVEYLLELCSTDPQVRAWCNPNRVYLIGKELHDVTGLKDVLGKDRWVEFIKQLCMGYSVQPARLGYKQ